MPDRHATPNTDLSLGVDLGGTKIAAGLFDEAGQCVGTIESLPTEAAGPREATIQNLHRVIEKVIVQCPEGREVRGIGVGSTGPLDPSSGMLLEADSLPSLFYWPIARELEARFRKPVFLTNDGNAFALAEARHGAGKRHGIVVGVTLGTGCGCGIVIHGRILEGATANTGELYRAPVSGRTFDEALSGRGLEAHFRERAGFHAPGAEVSRLADSGDARALDAFVAFGKVVGEGLSVIAAVIDPSIIVLGGSVSESLHHFLAPLQAELSRHVAPRVAELMKIASAQLGLGAGPLGAACLVFAGETIR